MPSWTGSVPAPSPHTDVLLTLCRRVETTTVGEGKRVCDWTERPSSCRPAVTTRTLHTHTRFTHMPVTDSHASRMHSSCTVRTHTLTYMRQHTGPSARPCSPFLSPLPWCLEPHKSGLFCSSEEKPGRSVTPPSSWALPVGGGWCPGRSSARVPAHQVLEGGLAWVPGCRAQRASE